MNNITDFAPSVISGDGTLKQAGQALLIEA